MSLEHDRWLAGLAGHTDGEPSDDAESRQGASVRDYLQRRAEVEDARPRGPDHEARMLAHLRARGAFAEAEAPAPGLTAAQDRPGWLATLAARLTAPLRPSIALGLGGACAAGFAFLVVVQDPGAGSRSLPAAVSSASTRVPAAPPAAGRSPGGITAQLAAATPESRPMPAAKPTPGEASARKSPAVPATVVARADPAAAAIPVADRAAEERAMADRAAPPSPPAMPRLMTRARDPGTVPSPNALAPQSMPMIADGAATSGTADGGNGKLTRSAQGSAPDGPGGSGHPEETAVESIGLDRLFDAGSAQLGAAGRKWLESWWLRRPQGLVGVAEASLALAPHGAVADRSLTPDFRVSLLAEQRLGAVAAFLEAMRSDGEAKTQDPRYRSTLPDPARANAEPTVPDSQLWLRLVFRPAARP